MKRSDAEQARLEAAFTDLFERRIALAGDAPLRADGHDRPAGGLSAPGHRCALSASAEVMRLGGRVGTTQMKLVNDESTLIATAAAAYMIS